MRSITLAGQTDFAGWRDAARALIAQNVAPEEITWKIAGEGESLFDSLHSEPVAESHSTFTVPRAFLDLAQDVALHSDPARFALLYRLLWRLRTEPRLLDVAVDRDVERAADMAKAVHRGIHKMHAFVRFREVSGGEPRTLVAWFEPTHHIVEATAPFFARRFPNFCWAILTSLRSVYWDMQALTFGPGADRQDAPAHDGTEELWRRYYASIFNPARLKVTAMRGHMPVKYWRNLPESELIPQLIADARRRTQQMIDKAPTAMPRIKRPATPAMATVASRPVAAQTLTALRDAARHCRDCPLWKNATQTVFGTGAQTARIMLVGEQPGDQEDLAGKPFVGPAGKVLDRALAQAGIDRAATYVTNAVKHFKFEPRGKRRIHKKPNEAEVATCHQWLEREIDLVRPDLVVALGATAARAVLGRITTIDSMRGELIKGWTMHGAPAHDVLVTIHPSYLLRLPDEEKDAAYARFVDDLRLTAPYARKSPDVISSPAV